MTFALKIMFEIQPNWHQMPSLMTNRLRFGLIRASTKGDWVRSLNWRRWSKLNKLLNFRSCSDWISNCFHQFCQKFNKILHKVFSKLRDGYWTAVTAMYSWYSNLRLFQYFCLKFHKLKSPYLLQDEIIVTCDNNVLIMFLTSFRIH